MYLFIIVFIFFAVLGYTYYKNNSIERFAPFVDPNELSEEARDKLGEKIRMGDNTIKLDFEPVKVLPTAEESLQKEIEELNKKIKEDSKNNKPKTEDKKTDNKSTTDSSSKKPVSTVDLSDYIPKSELSRYILKTEIPNKPSIDMSKYILKTEIPTIPTSIDLSKYIMKSEIPKTSNTIDVSDYILKTNIDSGEKIDMSKYVLKTDIPGENNNVDLSKYVLKSDLKECSKPKSIQDIKPDKNISEMENIHANDIKPPTTIFSNTRFEMPLPPFSGILNASAKDVNRPNIANFIFPDAKQANEQKEPQKQCVLTRRMFMGPDIYGAY